jgi:putative transposase
MIAPEAGLSISRQCTLLGVARSSLYYRPRPESAEELELLKRLDRIFTDHPVYGTAGSRWRCCVRGFRLAAGGFGG